MNFKADRFSGFEKNPTDVACENNTKTKKNGNAILF